MISRSCACARFLVFLCRIRRRSALPCRLYLRANIFLLYVTFSIFPLSLPPFLPCILFSRRGFNRPAPRRPVHLPSPGQISCLLTGFSPPSRFPRRYASFGVVVVGSKGLTCGFNWQCTADAIGYAVCSQHAWTPYRLLTYFHGLGPPRPGGSRGVWADRKTRLSGANGDRGYKIFIFNWPYTHFSSSTDHAQVCTCLGHNLEI